MIQVLVIVMVRNIVHLRCLVLNAQTTVTVAKVWNLTNGKEKTGVDVKLIPNGMKVLKNVKLTLVVLAQENTDMNSRILMVMMRNGVPKTVWNNPV
jgi:hypothetical protein